MNEIYYNKEFKKEFKKNDCPEDLGTTEVFVVPEAQFCSRISQEDADNKALEYANVEGPLYANRMGGCCNVYYSSKQEGDFYKNDCPDGFKQEIPTHYVVEAGRVYSTESVEDANYEARKILKSEGQAAANASGECKNIYWNERQHGFYSKKCRPGWKGPDKYKSKDAGTVYSFVSVEDANRIAKDILDKEAQEWVEENTRCEPIVDPCEHNWES